MFFGNEILFISALVLIFVILLLNYFWFNQQSTTNNKEPEAVERPNNGPRRANLARNRGARLRANVANQRPAAANASDADSDDNEESVFDLSDPKLGAKKRAKLEAKAERKAQRIAEEKLRQDKKKRDEQLEEERLKQVEKEKAEEKRKEEEELRLKQEQEKRELEEYLKMKEAFSVEEEGFEEGDGEEDEKNALQKFVEYIKNNKVVLIEDLASKFKLKTQSAIDRIKDLQSTEVLTGFIDDRGKFIYVSQDELEAVAKFIKQRGRVSISELAENSNRLINLTPVGSAS